MDHLEILKKELIGNFISRFSVGDTWELYFGHYWLVAQNVISDDEEFLNQLLFDNYKLTHSCVDKDLISKSIIITTFLRQTVRDIKLDDSCCIMIEFENGGKIQVPTNVDIVDWQWCLNESGNDPYRDYFIACFNKGEIQINRKKNKNIC